MCFVFLLPLLLSSTGEDVASLGQFRGYPYGTPKEYVLQMEKDHQCQDVSSEREGVISFLCLVDLYKRRTPTYFIFRQEDGALLGGSYQYPLWMGEGTLKASKGLQLFTALKKKYGEPSYQEELKARWNSPCGTLRITLYMSDKKRVLLMEYTATGDVLLQPMPETK